MSDLERELTDIGLAILMGKKELLDSTWRRKELFKEIFPTKAMPMIAKLYAEHIQSLTTVYELLAPAQGDKVERAMSSIQHTLFESITRLEKYRVGMKRLNESTEFYSRKEMADLDELVDACWKQTKPYLPG